MLKWLHLHRRILRSLVLPVPWAGLDCCTANSLSLCHLDASLGKSPRTPFPQAPRVLHVAGTRRFDQVDVSQYHRFLPQKWVTERKRYWTGKGQAHFIQPLVRDIGPLHSVSVDDLTATST
jgi:hypothetical protein